MRIVEYHVAEDTELQDMSTEVNRLIVEGWQPFGSMQVVAPVIGKDIVAPLYAQAMVKYADS